MNGTDTFTLEAFLCPTSKGPTSQDLQKDYSCVCATCVQVPKEARGGGSPGVTGNILTQMLGIELWSFWKSNTCSLLLNQPKEVFNVDLSTG